MPEISSFFGIAVRMFYFDHNPPHVHIEYRDKKIKLDFKGNILAGDIESRTALRLAREWIDFNRNELLDNWNLAINGEELKRIKQLE